MLENFITLHKVMSRNKMVSVSIQEIAEFDNGCQILRFPGLVCADPEVKSVSKKGGRDRGINMLFMFLKEKQI